MTDNGFTPIFRDLGWWAISAEMIMAALQRAHDGESPDLLYAELYANSGSEQER
jgi:hypothetical protein